ncbi:hypothetical protein CFC21_095494 [Triticum aestivum]|uniref:Uncharacterized protein n=2 Tax=Triticum aestivum TaxID=4565 RepID=A0A9R1GMT5_WHEAT|nr:hypothetical protein CFC21_058064 [Triticum aestivum]KAF7093058.1 hypothetical protein CFC21_095494 [Triticum aestivum]
MSAISGGHSASSCSRSGAVRRRGVGGSARSPVPSGAAHGLRADEVLQLVREEGCTVDLMESSKPRKEHGFIEWHEGPTTPFIRDLLGDLRDKVWMRLLLLFSPMR